ncbi:MAG: hypothetical protein M3Y04_03945, partial [Actinomycetota bacterium]|nr:hypothetical protein [Actinomycetota bacterium]
EERELVVQSSAFSTPLPVDRAPWRPSAADVANLIPQRTGDQSGRASGAFSSATVPTDTQVSNLIAGTANEVIAVVGATPDAVIATMAAHVTAVGTAAYVESGFYPDENTTGQGPAAQLLVRFQWLLAELKLAARGEGDIAGPPEPLWSFPAAVETGAGTTTWEAL